MPGVAALIAVLVAIVAAYAVFRRRLVRRSTSVRHLLELADRLEADLKSCRSGLRQAHAVMSLNPDQPATGEQEATQAIDAGLRSLLQQRIWIRDRASRASQAELDAAVRAMNDVRERLHPLLQALGQAQQELDSAMREHIRREPGA